MYMLEAKKVLNNAVSISEFNDGKAEKIFDSVKETGTKIVLQNNHPIAVLMSTNEFLEIMHVIKNARDYIEKINVEV